MAGKSAGKLDAVKVTKKTTKMRKREGNDLELVHFSL